ncbi:MAG TPA: N,N-dimethylformamidase beta subunit family domain-containing protein [Rhizomicrobium sp.]|nr:N,N-dimethylformamidase beta subunit family domain-containing protein [Rhizomicrobium sp.]
MREGRETTERRSAIDFDLLATLNGYPETFSVFAGEQVVLRVARKPREVVRLLPRLLVRLIWLNKVAATLRQKMLQNGTARSLKAGRVPVARAVSVTVRNRITNELFHKKNLAEPTPIFAELPARYKDNGADYTCRISLNTQAWPPGVYECTVHDDRGAASQDIYVNIRPRALDKIDLLCVLPSFTWQAYNRIGGGSFYSPELGHVRTICTQRPMHHLTDNSIAPSLALLSLFQRSGIRLACVDSWDLHEGKVPDGDVPVLAILVHDEYWSGPMRAKIDRLLDQGTSILVLSGNTCWWRVDVDAPNISVCKDPRKRSLWHLVDRPEEQTFVSSFRFGGYPIERAAPNNRGIAAQIAQLPRRKLRKARAITVVDPDHPLFRGIAVGDDRSFGGNVPITYREIDAVPLNRDGSIDLAAYKGDGLAPHIIARGLAFRGKHVREGGMVVEADVRKGYVLHMGSIGWARGVWRGDEETSKVVLNGYKHCLTKAAANEDVRDKGPECSG